MIDVFKLLLFQFVYYLARLTPVKRNGKHLLLLKVDEMGDYVLIRNCLSKFRESEVYKDYTITFVGNRVFRELFESLDSSIADQTIWIDKLKFRRNFFYRLGLLQQLRRAGFSDAVNLIYSRSWRIDDVLIAVSGATKRIGMMNGGMHLNLTERLLRPKNIYTQLIQVDDEETFDAYRYAEFVSRLLRKNIQPVTTRIPVSSASNIKDLPRNYCVIFPGSGISEKKWPAEKFAEVAMHLQRVWNISVVVSGSSADKEDCDKFLTLFQQPALDLVGKTNLTEMITILHSAKCLVSVDTGVVHLAAAVDCPVFGLFNGMHYGRFAPYPREIAANFFTIYPDIVDVMVADGSITHQEIPMDLVKTIPVHKVINKIDKFLTQQIK